MSGGKNQIDSLASLEKVVIDLGNEFGKEAMWWRGQALTSWPLKPKVYREPPKKDGEKNKKYIEHALINHFQMRALGRLGHRPRPWSDLEWMILAQHYGLPTRLLDWTENPLIALYFAVFDKSYETDIVESCLWALSPKMLNVQESNPGNPNEAQDGLIFSDEPVVRAMVMQAFGVKCKTIIKTTRIRRSAMPKVIALASGENDERIVAQSGRFTIHACDSALEDFERKDKYLRKFIIPKEAKEHLQQRLHQLGIRCWNVFPDLQLLAEGLNRSEFTSINSGVT
jgi:hypothetical protein